MEAKLKELIQLCINNEAFVMERKQIEPTRYNGNGHFITTHTGVSHYNNSWITKRLITADAIVNDIQFRIFKNEIDTTEIKHQISLYFEKDPCISIAPKPKNTTIVKATRSFQVKPKNKFISWLNNGLDTLKMGQLEWEEIELVYELTCGVFKYEVTEEYVKELINQIDNNILRFTEKTQADEIEARLKTFK